MPAFEHRATGTLGVILAGGRATRLGGGDKPLRLIGEATILDRIIDTLRPQVEAILLNANGDPDRFSAWRLPVVADQDPEGAGPLAGILAGLDWAARNRPDLPWVLTVTGNSPFLPDDLAARLHAAREEARHPLSCAVSNGRTHPPIALWPVALRTDLRGALRAGERKIDRWTARHGCATAAWDTEPFDPFFNTNTEEDLAQARSLASLRDRPYE